MDRSLVSISALKPYPMLPEGPITFAVQKKEKQLFFGGAEDGTQGPPHATQVLYH